MPFYEYSCKTCGVRMDNSNFFNRNPCKDCVFEEGVMNTEILWHGHKSKAVALVLEFPWEKGQIRSRACEMYTGFHL